VFVCNLHQVLDDNIQFFFSLYHKSVKERVAFILNNILVNRTR
jgi:hypothetical protein